VSCSGCRCSRAGLHSSVSARSPSRALCVQCMRQPQLVGGGDRELACSCSRRSPQGSMACYRSFLFPVMAQRRKPATFFSCLKCLPRQTILTFNDIYIVRNQFRDDYRYVMLYAMERQLDLLRPCLGPRSAEARGV
jgi:hypothetical protein